MINTLGIIGVGQLADYFVGGLRHGTDDREIVLGPRNAEKAESLAGRYQCKVASTNQEVVDHAELVLLSTRPADAIAALKSITLTDRHLLISVVAGLTIDSISPYCGRATVVRSLPVFSAEVCAGGMPLYPDHQAARALLSTLGQVITMPDEDQFETAAVMGCAFAWFIRMYAQLQSWMEQTGIDTDQARALALQCAHGASSLALAKPHLKLAELADDIARPGTFSLAGEEVLVHKGGLLALNAACDLVYEKLNENN